MAQDKGGRKGIGDGDTIVAIITPPGRGGIAALRLAGPASLSLSGEHFSPQGKGSIEAVPFLLRYGDFVGSGGGVIDQVMAVYMPKAKSYTGLEQVELFCHGGSQAAQLILEELVGSGARPAEPGEFTRLAFISGRIDLTQAEAVADIINAETNASYVVAREHLLGAYAEHVSKLREEMIDLMSEIEASIDYSEEEISGATDAEVVSRLDRLIGQVGELAESYSGGRVVKEGFRIAIAGRPNAGKSSLFNRLLCQERALVTPTPGTTRDYLSEWIDLGGYAVNIIDTAGLRCRGGAIERAGRESSRKILMQAELVVWMVDVSLRRWRSSMRSDIKLLDREKTVLVGNKVDLLPESGDWSAALSGAGLLAVSCLTGSGLRGLKRVLMEVIEERVPDLSSSVVVTSERHRHKLGQSTKFLKKARSLVKLAESPELTAFELRRAVNAIDEITGRVYNEEVLDRIFSKFCVGK